MKLNLTIPPLPIRRINLLILLVLIAFLGSVHLSAVIAEYSFAQETGQYAPLVDPVTVMLGNQDDVMSQPIDIGFLFVYNDVVCDRFLVNSNGFITFDPLSTTSYQNTLFYNPMIVAGFWDDLQTNSVNGNISYKLSGSAPNRILTVQFQNLNWYYNQPNNLISFQIMLYESSNVIRFVYGAMGNSPGEYGSASIGLSGPEWGDYIHVLPAYPSAIASSTEEYISLNGSHVQYLYGVSYVFYPPAALPNDLHAVSVTGDLLPVQGVASVYGFRIRNRGALPQSDYLLRVMAGTTQLAAQQGPFIQPGQIIDVQIPCDFVGWGPLIMHGQIVFAADENVSNNLTSAFNVVVQLPGTQSVTIGVGDVQSRVPMDFYWKNNLFECIYLASELNQTGLITGIQLYNNFSDDLSYGKPTRIWLGETAAPDLSGGWIPSTQLVQVFDGLVSYPPAENNIFIHLTTAYPYLGGNLVMMVQRPMDTEYYGPGNYFACQFIEGAARSLKVWSDSYLFDPASPPQSTPSGLYPKISFFSVSQGTGSLTGTVTHGGFPLAGAMLSISGSSLSTESQVQGGYQFPFIPQGTYQVTCSKFGFVDQTQIITILSNQTTVSDFAMQAHPTVFITGRVSGSDAPNAGLQGVSVQLTGAQNFSVQTDPQGYFIIPNVLTGSGFNYALTKTGYVSASGFIAVGTGDYDMGTMIMTERLNPPVTLNALEAPPHVMLEWTPPNPAAEDIGESFESGVFPPANWSQIVTNTGPANSYGALPTWSRVTAMPTLGGVIPPDGVWQAAIWWSDSHQDEWLISPPFVCPAQATLKFNAFIWLGPSPSGLDEHIYVKASMDDGNTWIVIWDSVTAGDGGFSIYDTPQMISLEQFAYRTIKLAWHADDPPDNSGLWDIAAIDNVLVQSPAGTLRLLEGDLTGHSNSIRKSSADAFSVNRELIGYGIWRLVEGQENDETLWTSLTPEPVTMPFFQDTGWTFLPEGSYRWAVKALYSNNIVSAVALSNPLQHQQQATGIVNGVVRYSSSQPVAGATITAGAFSNTSQTDGHYSLPLPVGTWSITCSVQDFAPVTIENVSVLQDQITVCDFIMGVDMDDEVASLETKLLGNIPNPFNPSTTIRFSLHQQQRVRIDIFNSRGQLVRALLDENRASGIHSVLWNGKDGKGRDVSSGVYFYRMQSDDSSTLRRMLLLK